MVEQVVSETARSLTQNPTLRRTSAPRGPPPGHHPRWSPTRTVFDSLSERLRKTLSDQVRKNSSDIERLSFEVAQLREALRGAPDRSSGPPALDARAAIEIGITQALPVPSAT